jgi:transposase
MTKKLMAGIDLHGNNLFCGMVDKAGRRVFEKKLPCDLELVRQTLAPFKKQLAKVAVESTYNWYWLVDGLREEGYEVELVNPAGMEQYNGIKQTDDRSDAFFLAEMLRLDILPTGYICEPELRSVRDLLRRRMLLVRKRTDLILSLKSLHVRVTGQDLKLGMIKAMKPEEVAGLFTRPADRLIARLECSHIEQLDQSIGEIEKALLKETGKLPEYQVLQSLPGVGRILGLTITLETGDIKRFPTAGDFASYCRCVNTQRISNGKKKGENNARCGNKYLAWAFVEAANFAKRYNEQCRRFYDRKAAQANQIVATKALACKLAKAAWHMMQENKPYDSSRTFPGTAKREAEERNNFGKAAGSHEKGLAQSPVV